jgi:hypothetical protein
MHQTEQELRSENAQLRQMLDNERGPRMARPQSQVTQPKSPENLSTRDQDVIRRALHLENLFDSQRELALKADAAERDFQKNEGIRSEEAGKFGLAYSTANRDLNADPENPVLARAVNDAKRAMVAAEGRIGAERRKDQEIATAARHLERTGREWALPELRRSIGFNPELFELDAKGIPRVRQQFRPSAAVA